MRLNGIGDDLGADGKFAHLQALRRGLAAEAAADLALGLRMQRERRRPAPRRRTGACGRPASRRCRRRRTPRRPRRTCAAAPRSAAPDRRRGTRTRPGAGRAAASAWMMKRKVLVLALADQDFIADDQRAECHAGILSGRLRGYAAFFAHFSSSSRPPMRWPLMNTCGTVPSPVMAPTMRLRLALPQRHFGVVVAQVLQQLLRARRRSRSPRASGSPPGRASSPSARRRRAWCRRPRPRRGRRASAAR